MRIVWVLKDIGYVLNQYLIFHVAPESEGHPCVFRQTHNCYHPVNMNSAQSCKVEPLYNATGMVKAIKDRTMCVLLGRRVDA